MEENSNTTPSPSGDPHCPGAKPTTKKTARTVASLKRKRVEAANKIATKKTRSRTMSGAGEDDAFFRKMTTYMDSQFKGVNSKLEGNSTQLAEVKTSLRSLSSQVANNTSDIEVVKKQIKDMRDGKEIEKRIDELVRSSLEKRAPTSAKISEDVKRVETEIDKIKAVNMVRKNDRQEGSNQEQRHYWWSRRAVRIWPVQGSTDKELWRSTGDFFLKVLEIPESHLPEDSVENIRRIYPARTRGKHTTRVKDEVRVLFKDVQTRDMVHSYAPNLAAKRDTAGMRLEVPGHLLGHFKSLERYGRHLKALHGPDLRWHIKYDDVELSMFLNVKLAEGESWNRVDSDHAKEEMKKQDAAKTTQFRDRLMGSSRSTSSVSSIGSDDTNTEEVMEITPGTPSGLPTSSTLEKYKGKAYARWGERK